MGSTGLGSIELVDDTEESDASEDADDLDAAGDDCFDVADADADAVEAESPDNALLLNSLISFTVRPTRKVPRL